MVSSDGLIFVTLINKVSPSLICIFSISDPTKLPFIKTEYVDILELLSTIRSAVYLNTSDS